MQTLRIDFVSDISCPWCVIGLGALEQALERLAGEVAVEIHFQPFELNPDMPAGGQDITEHLSAKYGSSPLQQRRFRDAIRERGEEVGFVFSEQGRSRIYNTFDAHRLLHWAGDTGVPDGVDGHPGSQRRLKKALFRAYFTDGRSPESHDVLLDAVREAGLDPDQAAVILTGDAYGDAVRERQAYYRERDINSVPATIINGQHLIPGGQETAVFERLLRKIATR